MGWALNLRENNTMKDQREKMIKNLKAIISDCKDGDSVNNVELTLREAEQILSALTEQAGKPDRFKVPTDKQIIDIAILFNDGLLDRAKVPDMVAMCQFVIDRLYENGDVLIPSIKEKSNE